MRPLETICARGLAMQTRLLFLVLILLSGPASCAGPPTGSTENNSNDAILNVLWLYAHHFDSRNLPAWLDLFTDDVDWKVYVLDQLRVELSGRNALEEYWQRSLNWSPSQPIVARHVITNSAILDRSDTTAQLRAYALVVLVGGARGVSISRTGHY